VNARDGQRKQGRGSHRVKRAMSRRRTQTSAPEAARGYRHGLTDERFSQGLCAAARRRCGFLAAPQLECSMAVSQSGATQSCRLRSQPECVGAAKAGSPNDPTATAIRPGNASASQQTVEPQTRQNWNVTERPASDRRLNWVELPEMEVICCRLNHAWSPNTAPVRRWHSRQWHAQTTHRSPQQHDARRVVITSS
jgi:hypothetical protein